MAIFLRPIDESNYRDVLQLSVAPDQERFVASNLQSLADACVWRGYIIVRLMIDARFQGLGYGREALAAIVEIVRTRGLATIRLSVLPDNDQAIEFYRRNGFAATGETEGDEIVMERAV